MFLQGSCVLFSVVIGVNAELDESRLSDVRQTESRIVSQWAEVSADEKHPLRDKVDEILHPLGDETSLLVIRHCYSLAVYFVCMTLAALTSLRDQWRRRQLRVSLQSLFNVLSGGRQTVFVKRVVWPVTDYERQLCFFSSVQGQQTIYQSVRVNISCITVIDIIISVADNVLTFVRPRPSADCISMDRQRNRFCVGF